MRPAPLAFAALLFSFLVPCHAAEKLSELRGVSRASFNHDASRVVVRGDEGAVTIWELPAGTPVPGDLDPKAESDGFLMSADGKLVAISFKDGRCRVFDSATAKAVSPPLDFKLNAEFEMPGLFSPDGNFLVLFGDTEAAVFEIQTGKKVATLLSGDNAHTKNLYDSTASAGFAAGGTQCFVLNTSGDMTRYNTKTWKAVGKPLHHPSDQYAYEFGLSLSEDGKWLATYDDPGENGPKSHLQVWDAIAAKPVGKPVTERNGLVGHFFGNNRILVLPGRGDATVRELPSLKVLYTVLAHDDLDGPKAEISQDGKWIFAWGPDKRLDLIDGTNGKVAGNYQAQSKISTVIVAPDSTACYVTLEGEEDQSLVKLVIPGLKAAETQPVSDSIFGVSLSRDGKRLMIHHGKGDQERLDIFDAATLKPLW